MNPREKTEIGTSGLRVTRLGFGGAPLGGLFTDVPSDEAIQSVIKAFTMGVRFFDTAPHYGLGKSERFIAKALDGVPRDDFVLSTKVGRVLDPSKNPPAIPEFENVPNLKEVWDYSRDGVLRSIEESMCRLNLDRIDIALIHDLDVAAAEDPDHWRRAVEEAYPTLDDLRAQGVLKAIGAGLNDSYPCVKLSTEGDFDCFLPAGRYTLLDQSALDELLPLCERKGISVIIGGPYNSGILASDLSPGAKYFYQDAPPEVLRSAERIKSICDRNGVPLKAAALQFCLGHPSVVSVIPGARSTTEVEENMEMAGFEIPSCLWEELRSEGLIREEVPCPG